MAKTKNDASAKLSKKQVSRPGVHSKTRTSVSKNSKHYKKAYRRQGK